MCVIMRRWADLLRKDSAVDFTIAETGLAKRGFMDFSESARGAGRASQRVSRSAGAGLAHLEPAMGLPRWYKPLHFPHGSTTLRGNHEQGQAARLPHGG